MLLHLSTKEYNKDAINLCENSQEDLFTATKGLQGFLREDEPKDRQGRIGVTFHGSSNSEEVKNQSMARMSGIDFYENPPPKNLFQKLLAIKGITKNKTQTMDFSLKIKNASSMIFLGVAG